MSDYLTSTEAERFVRTKHPNAKDVSVITHGYDSIVIIVDERLAYRFSRTNESAVSEHIEQKILKSLDGMKTIHTPIILETSESPAYICLSFLEGEHYPVERLRQFSELEKDVYIADLIAFMSEMRDVIPKTLLTDIKQHRLRDHDTWYEVLRIHLKEARFPDNPKLEAAARKYWDRWLSICHQTSLPEILVHDDLHVDNLLFINNKLSGVLDFADAGAGSAAQELRHLYRTSEEMVLRAVARYEEANGIAIDPNEVITWAIATEIASYHEHMSEHEHPSTIRAKADLRRWLPDLSL